MEALDPAVDDLPGRARECTRLRRLAAEAANGNPTGAVVSGPPGVGKTELIRWSRALFGGDRVLAARGVQTEQELAYAGLHQLLRPLLSRSGSLPAAQREALDAALGTTTGPAQPLAVGLAVLGLLAEAAESGPLLCLVDDAQWLDSASLSVVLFAFRRLQTERIALLLGERREPAAASVVTDPELERIDLAPLPVDDERRILGELTKLEIPRDVAERIHHATGGFPLATVEISRLLDEEQLTGRQPLPVPLPLGSAVQRLYEAAVRDLEDEVRHVLLVAAADDEGAPGVVERAGLILGSGPDALDRAERAGLLGVSVGRLEFRHPLVRAAVYATAPSLARRTAHRALARVYGEVGDIDRSAWHQALAAVKPDPVVSEEMAALAERSHRRSAHAAATAAFEMAADLAEGPEREAGLLVDAARCAYAAGQLERAGRLADRAEALGPGDRGEVDAVRGSIHLGMGRPALAFEAFLSAAEARRARSREAALEALNLAGECIAFTVDPHAARRLGSALEELDDGELDPRRRFLVRSLAGVAELFSDRVVESVGTFREAMEEHSSFDDPVLLALAGRVATYLGDDERARSLNTEAVERARAGGMVGALTIAAGRVELLDVLAGRFASALAIGEETIRLAADTGQPRLAVPCFVWSALVAAYRGEEDAFAEFLDKLWATIDRSSAAGAAGPIAWANGALHLGSGDPRTALHHLASIQNPIIRIESGFDALEAASAAGDQDHLAGIVGEMSLYAEVAGAAWARARVAYGHALLGNDSESRFEEAVAMARESPRRFETARIELAHGGWLRRARRRVEARERLRSAFDLFSSVGARPWAERAEAELRATGETVRRRDELSFDRLTPQELQVARQVAEGRTNREVAARLFISPRTVDHHLRNVFTKLGITSRTELARMEFDQG